MALRDYDGPLAATPFGERNPDRLDGDELEGDAAAEAA
jgi:hypothetical protein